MGLMDIEGVMETPDIEDRYLDSYDLGVIASEGTFSMGAYEKHDRMYNIKLSCKFSMTLSEPDKNVIENIHNRVSLGTTHINNTPGDNYPQIVWQIQSIPEAVSFSKLIDNEIGDSHKFMESNKYRDYKNWKKGLNILYKNHTLSEEDIITFLEIRDERLSHPNARSKKELMSISKLGGIK